MAAEPRLREMLRSQQVFPAGMPEFDPHAVPDDPVTLFLRWLEAAIRDAVPAPHAMTLATADDRGRPSSRVMICKDVDGKGRWYSLPRLAGRRPASMSRSWSCGKRRGPTPASTPAGPYR